MMQTGIERVTFGTPCPSMDVPPLTLSQIRKTKDVHSPCPPGRLIPPYFFLMQRHELPLTKG